MNFTEKQINNLLKDVYEGLVDLENLPVDLYTAISNYLASGLENIDSVIGKSLIRNLNSFSGAKVYSQIKEMTLIKNDETLKTYNEFKEEALKVYEQYNVNWLATEYNTTVQEGQNAVRWEQIQEQKQSLPFLQYSAVIDSTTDEICLSLNDITLPVDDPFWDANAPTNHFNCRCLLIQLDGSDADVTQGNQLELIAPTLNERAPLFNNNVGKSGVIFKEDHPYFNSLTDE